MSSFHFSQQTAPEEQLFADIQQLNAMTDAAQLAELVDLLVAFLTERAAADLLADLDAFAARHSVAPNSLRAVVKGLFFFFKEALRANLSAAHVREDLVGLGMAENLAGVVAQKWKADAALLSRCGMGRTLVVNEISDMRWRFGVTTADTDRDKVGAAFMQFRFVLDKGDGKKENVHMEMTLQQFYEFVHQLEQAKAQLDFFG